MDSLRQQVDARAQALIESRRAVLKRLRDYDTSKPPKMLVEQLLVWGSINMIHGDSGSAKSFLAMEIARGVASGTPVLGVFNVPEPANVLFIQQDMATRDFVNASKALFRSMDPIKVPEEWAYLDRELSDTLVPWPHPDPALNLLKDEDVKRVIETANDLRTPSTGIQFHDYTEYTVDENGDVTEQHMSEETDTEHVGARLIIIDCLRDFIGDESENESGPMSKLVAALRKIRAATNAAIIVIHHDTHTGHARGSTAIPAGLDGRWQVTGQGRGTPRTVRAKKDREVPLASFKFRVDSNNPEDGAIYRKVHFEGLVEGSARKENGRVKQETGTYDQLVEYLRTRTGGLTVREASDSWGQFNGGISRDTLRRWLDQMVADGESLMKEDPAVGKRSPAKRYFPTESTGTRGPKTAI